VRGVSPWGSRCGAPGARRTRLPPLGA